MSINVQANHCTQLRLPWRIDKETAISSYQSGLPSNVMPVTLLRERAVK